MKFIIPLLLLFISVSIYCQPADKVLKFDCKAYLVEDLKTKEKATTVGYHLIVIDYNKAKINIYPDSVMLNIVGEITTHQVDKRFFIEYTCIDKMNRTCKAVLSYLDGVPEIMRIGWDNFNLFYFIEKQIQ